MRREKPNFIDDKRGVSPIIGALLMLAILVGMGGVIQSSSVPVWNMGVEYDHLGVIYSDMMSLKSDIEDVALHKSPKSSEIHLGVRYPERVIFMNPGEGATGTLAVESGVNISVNYTTSGASAPDKLDYSSSRITYELHGTINSPKYVYEHGILIRDSGTSSVTTDEQKLIVGDNIYIPILYASELAKSSLDVESLTIHPYLKASTDLNVESITITFDTAYPGIWWDPEYRAEFEAQFPDGEIPNELKTRDILGNLSSSSINVSVSPEGDKIILESNASDRIDIPDPDSPIDQPQANQLYAGVLKCYMGELDPVWYYGETTASMSSGTQWSNIPNSSAISEMNITKIVVDPENVVLKLGNDYILITVVDADGDWWKVVLQMDYKAPDTRIVDLTASSASGTSIYLNPDTGNKLGVDPLVFDNTTWIDLLSESNWDTTSGLGGCYQNASIGDINTLLTTVGDKTDITAAGVIYYLLKVAGG